MGQGRDQPTDAHDSGDLTARQFRRALQLETEGDWDEAVKLYTAVSRQSPAWPKIFERLGDAQVAVQRWKAAAQSYVRAIERQGEHPVLFQKLGDVQRQCSDTVGAAESYRREAQLRRRQRPAPRPEPADGPDAASAYLELMKDCLTFLLWQADDGPIVDVNVRRPVASLARLLQRLGHWLRPAPTSLRELGMDWPKQALTMIGRHRLGNIQHCVERVLHDDVPGDLLEAGVWRGGATIFMGAVLRAYGDTDRKVWVADSFSGLPRPDVDAYPQDQGYDLSVWRSLAVSADEVRRNFQRFGLLDDRVLFLEGWFADTLPSAPIDRLAVLRLDGDLYQSTMDTLVPLYPKVSKGGFVLVDDYYSAPPCREAVDDFRERHGITDPIERVDGSGAFWRKG